MVLPSTRGGVPVLKRSSTKPNFSKLPDNFIDGCELLGPDEYINSPMIILPRAAVPVVKTTVLAP